MRASSPTRASQGCLRTDELRSNCFESVARAAAHVKEAEAYLIYSHFSKDTEGGGGVLRCLQENRFVWLDILQIYRRKSIQGKNN